MNAATLSRTRLPPPWFAWLPVAGGLVLLYGPTWLTLARTLWATPEYSNGPIIGATALWLAWRRRGQLAEAPRAPWGKLGLATLLGGLLLAVVGRLLASPALEIATQIPVLAGILLFLRGPAAMRAVWFPLAFLLFMIPLPGSVLVPMTAGLKQWIAVLAEQLLYASGLPVAREGVTINIGQYRLFVADACAGLHSILSLSALGVLYVYLSHRASIVHNAAMLASIVPIALAANLVRVLFLVLATYWFGDSAAKQMHDVAGASVFVAELLLLFVLDRALARQRAP